MKYFYNIETQLCLLGTDERVVNDPLHPELSGYYIGPDWDEVSPDVGKRIRGEQ